MPRVRKPIVNEALQSGRRIPFGPEIMAALPCRFVRGRGWTHRRHIISQHFLREAWNRMAPAMFTRREWLREIADLVVRERTRLPAFNAGDLGCLRIYASEILRAMNDNPHNLFVEDGGENSGIGSFTHEIGEWLNGIEAGWEEWDDETFVDIRDSTLKHLHGITSRFGAAAVDHIDSIRGVALDLVAEAGDAADLISALQDLAFSTDFDMPHDVGARARTAFFMEVHHAFDNFAQGRDTDLDRFGRLIGAFVRGPG